jgi:hypothetical protein
MAVYKKGSCMHHTMHACTHHTSNACKHSTSTVVYSFESASERHGADGS